MYPLQHVPVPQKTVGLNGKYPGHFIYLRPGSVHYLAIIEPTLFGMLVKNKKLFLAQIIGGAVGGAYLGLMKVVTNAFVFGSVTTFPCIHR